MEPLKKVGTPLKGTRTSQQGPLKSQPTTHQGQRQQAVRKIPLGPPKKA